MAKPDLGSKRQCLNCGTKFFDFNRSPILCPKCATVFQATPLPRSQPRAAVVDDDAEVVPAGAELVSLEDAEAGDEKAPVIEDDVEIADDDTAADDDTFLEEEEADSDDVADLIDGDIADDEES